MNIRDLLKEDSIILNEHFCNKELVLDRLIQKHVECGHVNNEIQFKNAILKREELSSTGVGNMIAIPHAQDDSVCYPSLVAMVDREGVNFNSLDQQPAKLFFMIAVPKDGGTQHLEILAQLCQVLMEEAVVLKMLDSKTPEEFLNNLTTSIKEEDKVVTNNIDIVAVTACPTGIAHTYMAAKSLEDTAIEMGINIKVETNGASGVKNKLSKRDIEEAKYVIVAADKKVDMGRFNGKYLIQVPVASGIHDAKELLIKGLNQEAEIYNGKDQNIQIDSTSKVRKFYAHLMSGISQIIPILMIFGILYELTIFSTVFTNGQMNLFQKVVYQCASLALALAIPIISAFIADSISEKSGFVTALVCAGLATSLGANIIECIMIGFLSGYLVLGLNKLFVYLPEDISSIIPNLLLPISSTLIMCILLYFVYPFFINYTFIAEMNFHPLILIIIGCVLGAMMSVDMGGPINKTAYCIGIIGVFIGREDIMSAVMIGGMIPPLVIWLTMLISPSSFSEDELKGKWRCLIKGLCFVSEEAIPYMKKDTKGIHIPCIIASGLAGALSMYFMCSQKFPHGGIFTLLFINNPQFYLIALSVSILIGMSLVLILRKSSY